MIVKGEMVLVALEDNIVDISLIGVEVIINRLQGCIQQGLIFKLGVVNIRLKRIQPHQFKGVEVGVSQLKKANLLLDMTVVSCVHHILLNEVPSKK